MRFVLLIFIALVVLAGAGLGLGYGLTQQALEQKLALDQEQLIEVAKGSSPGQELEQLAARNILQGAFWLRLYWRLELKASLHSGEYRLTPEMTARDLLGLWQRGEVVQYKLTLVEGWTFKQVREALAAQQALQHLSEDLSDAQLMERLGYAGEHPEGRFFPATYNFVRGSTDLDLLRQAYRKMAKVLAAEWAVRAADLPYETPYQALIMASLIEKETGVGHERAAIAGVFVRRLTQGMLLQTDPTVIYGLGARYQGRLTRDHLRAPSAYNTYLLKGLPPTPIAMPGRAALHAALHPASGNSLYFVAKGDGSHEFNATLEAHNKAVRAYQLKRRADYRSSPAAKESK